MFIETKFIKLDELPADKLWCYMCPRSYFSNPWHAGDFVQLFYSLDKLCPANFVKIKRTAKKQTVRAYDIPSIKTLVARR
jgi:hypothetical protein